MFRSLRWKFTALYVVASVLVLIAVGFTIFILESRALSHRIEGSIRAGGDSAKAATATSLRQGEWTEPLDAAAEAFDTVAGYRWLSAQDVFIVLLDQEGRIVANPNNVDVAAIAGRDSMERALRQGEDWRTVHLTNAKLRTKTFPLLDSAGQVIGFVQAGKSMEDTDAALTNLILFMAVSGAAGTLLLALGGYVVAGRAIRPVQQSYERQRQFVADASHELRTPLTVIRTNAGVLARQIPASESVQDIEAEARYMSKLLGNLLLLANGDRRQLQVDPVPLNLSEVARSVMRPAEALTRNAGISFRAELGEALPVMADPERCRQVMLILLDNAIKYTQPGGEVVVVTRRDSQDAIVEVRDNGRGMTQHELSRATDRFFTGGKARPRSNGSAGLGLSIATELMSVLGGNLQLESERGRGTTARLRLPLVDQPETLSSTVRLRRSST
ncbi:MAG: hypothetical protein GEU75_08975 [Dehalococcoidia bacterium]|nr:hypothetical protein [Dehalococcoidia bacterium]